MNFFIEHLTRMCYYYSNGLMGAEVPHPLINEEYSRRQIMGKRNDINKVLIIGSGPIIIGQACEFDYSGTQACKALRKLGYKIVLVNSNPATIMTDPDTADVTYIEPLNAKRLEQIIAKAVETPQFR